MKLYRRRPERLPPLREDDRPPPDRLLGALRMLAPPLRLLDGGLAEERDGAELRPLPKEPRELGGAERLEPLEYDGLERPAEERPTEDGPDRGRTIGGLTRTVLLEGVDRL